MECSHAGQGEVADRKNRAYTEILAVVNSAWAECPPPPRALGQRQSNLEICAAWNRVDRNISVMRANNSIHGIQAHACAISNAFGGIKRFKNMRLHRIGNATPVVNNLDKYVIELPRRPNQ